jgi:NAD(P)H-hydrate epimerase
MKSPRTMTMTREQVRAFDQNAINVLKIPGVVLMENAGLACAQMALSMLPSQDTAEVCIFCGPGNNGGDGYVIGRHLLNHGLRVRMVIVGDIAKVCGDALIHLVILKQLHVPIETLPHGGLTDLVMPESCDLIIDALLGTGLEGPLKPPYRDLIEAINRAGIPILAVDIPSGLDCDTGVPLGDTAIKADQTVTFVAVKVGFQNPDAAQYTGRVTVASIGIVPQ